VQDFPENHHSQMIRILSNFVESRDDFSTLFIKKSVIGPTPQLGHTNLQNNYLLDPVNVKIIIDQWSMNYEAL
jgi:hypothetical protein